MINYKIAMLKNDMSTKLPHQLIQLDKSNLVDSKKKIICPDLKYQHATSSDILEICHPLFETIPFSFFSHVRAFHNGEFSSLMTNTELTEHHLRKKYPTHISLGNGIYLNSGFYIIPYMEELVPIQVQNETRKNFNLDHMIYFVKKQKTYDDLYIFAAKPENKTVINQFINGLEIIEHFINYYKDKAAKLIKNADKIRYNDEYFNFSLKNLVIENFSNSIIQKDIFDKMPIKKIYVETDFGEISISEREFDCLKYFVRNFTLKEIAKFLDLSPRTVETYINNLKLKLRCDSKADLVRLASNTIL